MSETAVPLKTPRRKRLRWIDVKENFTGYALIAPATLLIAIFGLFPIVYAVYMSLYNWTVRRGDIADPSNYQRIIGDWSGAIQFIVGVLLLAVAYWLWNKALKSMSNRRLISLLIVGAVLIGAGVTLVLGWNRMLATGDQAFLNSLPIAVFFAIGSIPLEIIIGMVLAYFLFQKIRGRAFFRMLYFLPYIMPIVATAVVFRIIFSPRDTSLANQALVLINQPVQKWLLEPRPFAQVMLGWQGAGYLAGPSMALTSIIMFNIWTFVGYNVVIFLAGLGAIPPELYEVAELDGANSWHLFRHVTIPLLSPVTFYLALIGFIGTLKAFTELYVMRTPSALGTVDTTSLVIFDTFYKANQYGYAAAEAILLFLIILGLTFAQNKLLGERVFYG